MLRRGCFKDGFFKNEKYILFILMLYLINPLDYGNYLVFLLLPILMKRKILVTQCDNNLLILLAFSLTYVSIIYQYKDSYSTGFSNMAVYLAVPVMMYSLGKYFQKKYVKEYSFYRISFIILLMYCFVALISIGLDIYHSGFKGERNIILLNLASVKATAATLISSSISLFLVLSGTLLIPAKFLERRYKKIFILFSLIALIFTIRLGSRTGLVIFVLSFVLNYILFIKYISARKKIICTFAFLIFLFVASNVSIVGNSDVFYSYQERLESAEYGSSTVGGRTNLWSNGIDNLIKYPMGATTYVKKLSYSHNFWLDIGRVAGVIPMFFMLVFCLRMLRILYKVVKDHSISMYKRSIVFSLHIAFFAVFGVEPILEGDFVFVSVYFFFSGIVYALYQQSKNHQSQVKLTQENKF